MKKEGNVSLLEETEHLLGEEFAGVSWDQVAGKEVVNEPPRAEWANAEHTVCWRAEVCKLALLPLSQPNLGTRFLSDGYLG